MKVYLLLFLLLSAFGFSQKEINIDSAHIKNATEIHFDDYDQLYIYTPNDQSLKKYDSLGKKNSQIMLPRPYKIQSISNPLSIVLFSVNSQEIKLIDQNLNDVQTINLSKNFGFVTAAYVEDLQTVWVVDNSNKSINQLQYRSNKLVNSTPFHINTEGIIDFLVHNNTVYILKNKSFDTYTLQGENISSHIVNEPIRLKRNNNDIHIITNHEILNYNKDKLLEIKKIKTTDKIVDKNRSGLLVKNKNKLYLYKS